jgi:hypothetical protein
LWLPSEDSVEVPCSDQDRHAPGPVDVDNGRMQLQVGQQAPSRRGRWKAATRLLLACGAWVIVAAVHLFGIWIANLWVFAWAVYGLAWLVAIAITGAGVVSLWSRRGPAWAVPTLALSLVTATAIVTVDGTYLFAHGYYRLNRADFAAVAILARSDMFGAESYYGDRLSPDLQHLSINGRAARITVIDPPQYRYSDTGLYGLFLPAWAGIPDGAVGYAYLVDAPTDVTFDCFADACRVRWSLGDGWYWLDRS